MNPLFHFLSKWRNLLLLFALFILANVLLGQFMPKEHALDLKFAYSSDEAFAALANLNDEERSNYKLGILAFDMPYLVIYGLFFSGILFKLWKKKWVALIPTAVAIFDLLENILVLQILKIFPDQNFGLAQFASVFTTGKWVMAGFLLVLILVGLFISIRNGMKSKSLSEIESA